MNLSVKLILTSSLPLALIIGFSRPNVQGYFLSASAAIAAGSTTKMVCDRRSKILQSQLDSAGKNLHQSIKDFDECKAILASNQLSFEKAKKEAEYSQKLAASLTSENNNYQSQIDNLNRDLSDIRLRLIESQKQLQHQQDINLEWQNQFQEKVSETANKLLLQAKKTELENIYREHDSISNEAINLFSRLQSYVEKINSSHDSKSQIIKSLATNYNENIDSINSQIDNERGQYLQQIEALNERVGLLQSQLHGDLLSPIYPENSFNEVARVASAIIKLIWINYNIPLEFCGFDSDSFGVKIGNQNVENLCLFLNSKCQEIAKTLGIFEVSFKQLAIAPIIQCRVRVSRPVVNDDDIYRILEKPDQFSAIVARYHDHQQGGKPTLRVMSGTGGGKSLACKHLINHYLQFENDWLIWLSDPMDGSSEDHWGCSKVATNKSESHQVLKAFGNEFNARSQGTSRNPSQKLLLICDEFDKQHSNDDKDLVKSMWTAIRHHQMRLILIGQSSEVKVNRMTWDELKNCSLLFIGDAVDTALKHDRDLGFSPEVSKKLSSNWDKIHSWLETKNEDISDPDKKHRVALLVSGKTTKFLEIPPALPGYLVDGSSRIAVSIQDSFEDQPIKCSHCGSQDYKKNGSYQGRQRYRCNQCQKSFT